MVDWKNKESITDIAAVAGSVAGCVTGGAAAGAAAGGLTGPVGAALGAGIGAAVGAIMGRQMADPEAEDSYWRDNFLDRPYVDAGASFDDYSPAFRLGVASYFQYRGQSFDDVEPELRRDWIEVRGNSALEWDLAKHAVRDAWIRLQRQCASPTSP